MIYHNLVVCDLIAFVCFTLLDMLGFGPISKLPMDILQNISKAGEKEIHSTLIDSSIVSVCKVNEHTFKHSVSFPNLEFVSIHYIFHGSTFQAQANIHPGKNDLKQCL